MRHTSGHQPRWPSGLGAALLKPSTGVRISLGALSTRSQLPTCAVKLLIRVSQRRTSRVSGRHGDIDCIASIPGRDRIRRRRGSRYSSTISKVITAHPLISVSDRRRTSPCTRIDTQDVTDLWRSFGSQWSAIINDRRQDSIYGCTHQCIAYYYLRRRLPCTVCCHHKEIKIIAHVATRRGITCGCRARNRGTSERGLTVYPLISQSWSGVSRPRPTISRNGLSDFCCARRIGSTYEAAHNSWLYCIPRSYSGDNDCFTRPCNRYTIYGRCRDYESEGISNIGVLNSVSGCGRGGDSSTVLAGGITIFPLILNTPRF